MLLTKGPPIAFRTKGNCLRVREQGPIAELIPEQVWSDSAHLEVLERIIQSHLIGGFRWRNTGFARLSFTIMASAGRIIAIDGPAGAGKSTIARSLATRVNAIYIDTGAMYRAVGLVALRAGISLTDSAALEVLAREAKIEFVAGEQTVLLNGEDVTLAIRRPEVSRAASKVAAIPGVRAAMVDLQRRIAEHRSVVMEGRDIGSVVFPDAEVKIYLDASTETRVRRRAADLEASGLAVDLELLRQEIEERDHRDRTRASSPLVRAPGATYIDSSDLTPGEVEAALLKVIERNPST